MRSPGHFASVMFVCLGSVLLLIPPAPAAPAAITFSAPFNNAQHAVVGWKTVQSGCGLTNNVTQKAGLLLRSGTGVLSVNLTWIPCHSPTPGENDIYARRIGLVGLNFTVPSSGSYTVSALWNTSINLQLGTTSSGCALGTTALGWFGLHLRVRDVSGRYFVLQKSENLYGPYSPSLPVNKQLVAAKPVQGTVSLVSGHPYALETSLTAYLQVENPGNSACTGTQGMAWASASMGLVSSGSYAILRSLTVS